MQATIKMKLLMVILLLCNAMFHIHAINNNTVEISWVLDVSGTITTPQLEKSILYINTITKRFPISATGNKAGVTTFGNEARIEIFCKDHSTTDSFLTALNGISRLPNQLTNVEDGLRKGQRVLTTNGCGERPVPRVMFLITDGNANHGGDLLSLIAAATEIRNDSITLFAAAVGIVNINVLNQIVHPSQVLQANNTVDLNDVLTTTLDSITSTTGAPTTSKQMTTTIKPTTTGKTTTSAIETTKMIPTTRPRPECNKLEIDWVLDVSETISTTPPLEESILNSILKSYPGSTILSGAEPPIFGDEARIEISCINNSTTDSFVSGCGNRTVPRVMFLITDRDPNQDGELLSEIAEFSQTNDNRTTLFVVAVGNINLNQLYEIINPGQVLQANNFDDLNNVLKTFLHSMCSPTTIENTQ